ncbi:hypothetical protein GF337_09155 [candidate division KSB1 bacterium]|nr:hypothetical protein [candidate division KSB1 bacterium]
MKQKAIIILMIMVLLFTGSIAAQEIVRIPQTNPNYQIDDWTSYTMTRWMYSLAKGYDYIYFATSGGIARFNHYTRKWDFPWTVSNGLADNEVHVVGFDFDTAYLWCATPYSVSVYFSTFRRWENYYFDDMGLPMTEKIVSIGFDRDYVWLENANGRILRGNKRGGGGFNYASLSPGNNTNIRWFGFRGQQRGELPRFFMSSGYFFEPEGFITDVNLNEYDISYWLLSEREIYWLATYGLGAARAEARIDQLELLTYGLFLNNVSAMDYDKENDIFWTGGMGDYEGESGITKWNISARKWDYYRADYLTVLQSDQVTSVAVDEDPFVWFGTDAGLALYNKNKNDWKFYTIFEQLTDNFVYDIALDDTNVWVGTASGVTRIIKQSLQNDSLTIDRIKPKALHDVEVYDVEIMKNLIWMGTQFGVYVYDLKRDKGGFQSETSGPRNEPVYAVSVYENEIWFGLEGGVEVYDMTAEKWLGGPQKRFNEPETIAFLKADEKAVWAATEDHGVLKYDKERGRWVHFTIEDGLPSNTVNTIVLDSDYVWFGSPEGITKFYWNAPYRID